MAKNTMSTKLPRKTEIGTKDASGGRADKVGSVAQESERGSGGGTGNLFSTNSVTHRKKVY